MNKFRNLLIRLKLKKHPLEKLDAAYHKYINAREWAIQIALENGDEELLPVIDQCYPAHEEV